MKHLPANDNIGTRVREIWEPRIGKPLNDEELRQIATGVPMFFSILADWNRRAQLKAANDNILDGVSPNAAVQKAINILTDYKKYRRPKNRSSKTVKRRPTNGDRTKNRRLNPNL